MFYRLARILMLLLFGRLARQLPAFEAVAPGIIIYSRLCRIDAVGSCSIGWLEF
jgi:hypothetical protein